MSDLLKKLQEASVFKGPSAQDIKDRSSYLAKFIPPQHRDYKNAQEVHDEIAGWVEDNLSGTKYDLRVEEVDLAKQVFSVYFAFKKEKPIERIAMQQKIGWTDDSERWIAVDKKTGTVDGHGYDVKHCILPI